MQMVAIAGEGLRRIGKSFTKKKVGAATAKNQNQL